MTDSAGASGHSSSSIKPSSSASSMSVPSLSMLSRNALRSSSSTVPMSSIRSSSMAWSCSASAPMGSMLASAIFSSCSDSSTYLTGTFSLLCMASSTRRCPSMMCPVTLLTMTSCIQPISESTPVIAFFWCAGCRLKFKGLASNCSGSSVPDETMRFSHLICCVITRVLL